MNKQLENIIEALELGLQKNRLNIMKTKTIKIRGPGKSGNEMRAVNRKRKTMKDSNDLKLEEALYIWSVQKRSKGEPKSGCLLCEEALQFNNQLDGS